MRSTPKPGLEHQLGHLTVTLNESLSLWAAVSNSVRGRWQAVPQVAHRLQSPPLDAARPSDSLLWGPGSEGSQGKGQDFLAPTPSPWGKKLWEASSRQPEELSAPWAGPHEMAAAS